MSKASRKRQRNSPPSKTKSKTGGEGKGKKEKASSPQNIKKQSSDKDAQCQGSACCSGGGCDYSSRDYWEKRYEGEEVGLEWYCSLEHIRPLIESVVPKVMDARKLPLESDSSDLVVDKGTLDSMLCDPSGKKGARALCKEGARVTAMGGWFVVVSHVHPSSEEGMEFLSDAFAAGLEDSTPHGEAIWSVDVHCCEPEVDEEEGSKDEKEEEALDPPSVYMAHKVARRYTRSKAVGEPREIPVRIHEY